MPILYCGAGNACHAAARLALVRAVLGAAGARLHFNVLLSSQFQWHYAFKELVEEFVRAQTLLQCSMLLIS